MMGLAVALCVTLGACSKAEPPPPTSLQPSPAVIAVRSVTLGNAIGQDKRIRNSTARFAPNDTIYAIVETSGSGNATLKATWNYLQVDKNLLLKEESIAIIPSAPTATTFQISKADGWQPGDYRLDIALDGRPVGNYSFTVR